MFYAHDCYRSPMKSWTSYCTSIHKYKKVMLIQHRRRRTNVLQSCASVKEQNGLRLFTDFHGQWRRILCLGHGLTTFFKMRPALRGVGRRTPLCNSHRWRGVFNVFNMDMVLRIWIACCKWSLVELCVIRNCLFIPSWNVDSKPLCFHRVTILFQKFSAAIPECSKISDLVNCYKTQWIYKVNGGRG